ncbi:phosphoadenosine phosphosulfate reductase family protein [Burkholderia cenocepacia]|jgi:3'-phosphoadenosine 5'-phosphosulfate sulfotransferase (PAPS reductase)/FAD synthetase|uniref:phosphoadenosine phosphosulfate reductase family protein n=1 Tax=Burkholderia cenocepacia TaxID=95486 RepID=UPI00222E52C3|nr:phosphoadenosine phosphosulfate reductase family protein [Burkholderia cenocepacia]MCW3521210.1 phosphoadenosine phosphosulfate reductase family protein [Burkholderia cenocepacia]MCW3612397.1 phosphoadenosine phosphosulfate reductase family protein [Burkholderia cenocepacia]MCW3650235.1 phosphoadenosine phosphosulfate reductase family protein [Burkholderia cenocepacia]MCW3664228.1 phosphoadenosine phosphosulfate reductase family protein [Burkholderia cenocepacia]MCW3678978.1 phosphoadenosin
MLKVVVPISGGKDSQACLELATKLFGVDDIRGLFCDTQFEHPITYKHIDWMREHYGVHIDTVSGGTVLDKCLKYARFPGGGARHCTDELKIRETRIYLKALAEQHGGFEVWYGMRTGESTERATRYANKISEEIYEPHEVLPGKYPKYLGRMGVRFRLPILDWPEERVLELLDGRENPLYRAGFPRVGCFPCLASGDRWKEKAFQFDDVGRDHFAKVTVVSAKIGKSVWTSKGGKARNEEGVCALCSI